MALKMSRIMRATDTTLFFTFLIATYSSNKIADRDMDHSYSERQFSCFETRSVMPDGQTGNFDPHLVTRAAA
jgi:hypothetical protein